MESFKTTAGPERRVNHTEKLQEMLRVISSEINAEAQKHGLEHLVDSDCAVSMDGFLRNPEGNNGGIYTREQIEGDKREVKRRELKFSNATIPATQKYYHEQKGLNTPEEIVEYWRKSKIENKNGQTEMAVTVLLHKMLKEEFLVVRSASTDDYSGVDNLILNKRTGEAICAFDEVHEGGKGERLNEKMEKVKKIAAKGGVKIRYGIGLEQGQLKRSKMEKVPVFYLGLKSEELMKLLEDLQYGREVENSVVEYDIFRQLVKSLREQKNLLEAEVLPTDIVNKLQDFEKTLQTLESFAPESLQV